MAVAVSVQHTHFPAIDICVCRMSVAACSMFGKQDSANAFCQTICSDNTRQFQWTCTTSKKSVINNSFGWLTSERSGRPWP